MGQISKVGLNNSINTHRLRFNQLLDSVGDLGLLATDRDSDLVSAINSVDSNVGTRLSLTTDKKTNLVTAINSVDSNVGTRTSLTTTNKSSLVSAINEHDTELGTITASAMKAKLTTTTTVSAALAAISDSIGSGPLTTTTKTVVGAINEHDAELGTITASAMKAKLPANSTVSAAIAAMSDSIGSGGLNTTSKNLVGAVNEVNGLVTPLSTNIKVYSTNLTVGKDSASQFKLDVAGNANVRAGYWANNQKIVDSNGQWVGSNSGLIGYTGSRGVTGFTGSFGTTGFTGSVGFTGSFGTTGFTGSRGFTGSVGFTGSFGITGFTGSEGAPGAAGIYGYTGSAGTNGFTGSRGFTGSVGSTGFTGSVGTTGFTGSQGIEGLRGFTGSKGDTGTTGFTGSRGFTGSQGDIGFTGSRGFTGSFGTTGFTGSQGDIGFTGSRGFSGSAGPSTTINATDDTSSTALYPVFVNAAGSNQTAKTSSDRFLFDAVNKTFVFGTNTPYVTNYTGTDSATADFQIHGAGTAGSSIKLLAAHWSNNNTASRIQLAKTRGNLGTIAKVSSNDNIGDIQFLGTDSNDFLIAARILCDVDSATSGSVKGNIHFLTTGTGTNITSRRLSIKSNGLIGINNENPAYQLDVAGTLRATGSTSLGTLTVTGSIVASGDITAFSDAKLKSNIHTIDGALNKVMQMRGVYFDKDEKTSVGVIAQEIEKVLPEVVVDGIEYKSVAYGNIVGVLIEAIKELKAEVEELKEK